MSIGTAAAIEAPAEEWNRSYPSDIYGVACSVQQTTDGGYVVAGEGASYMSDSIAFMSKTNSTGDLEWVRIFEYKEMRSLNGANSVRQTGDGGYILAGFTSDISLYPEVSGAWMIKTDSMGNEVWNRTFGNSSDEAESIQQTTDGGFILAGHNNRYTVSDEAWLLKTDSTGNEIWVKKFTGSSICSLVSVQQTEDQGYIVAGCTDFYGSNDAWLLKLDSAGNEVWNKTFGGPDTDRASCVRQTGDGGYILAGHTEFSGSSDGWLIKTDSNGNEIWSKTLGGAGISKAKSVQQTADGEYVVVCFCSVYNNARLLKTDSMGNEVWNKTFGEIDSYDRINCVQQTEDLGYILAGETRSYPYPSDGRYWLIKVAPENVSGSGMNLTVIIGEPEVSIEINRSSLNFGTLLPGQNSTPQFFNIKNTGSSDVNVSAELTDTSDEVFLNGIYLNSFFWPNFYELISKGGDEDVEIMLRVPANYSGSGIQKGYITFWAEKI